jgi:class 3 adenylate cyclase/tetratricopeptide (TPR) repeat protein
VTVLFADIVDSTRLAEELGAEEMHARLSRFFDLVLAQVHRFEGTINQFLGDGFMAIFGAPLALEHHARHAVLASLAIQRVVAEHHAQIRTGFVLRIGINTGWVVVGRIGDNLRMDYTAIGDTTHVAARLQQLAEPGTILITDSTHQYVAKDFRVEPLGPTRVKGKRDPVLVHRVVGAAPRRAPAQGLTDRPSTTFVGRDHDIDTLIRLFTQVEQGNGQLVGLIGEPGIGKSRLLNEFRRHLAGHKVTYLEGRCVSYGSTAPYLPILDITRQNCNIEDLDPPETVAAKLRLGLEEVGVNADDGVPYLLHLLGLKEDTGSLHGLSAEVVRTRTWGVIRQLLLKGSQRRPIVLAIEDLHWVDSASEGLLEHLIDGIIGASVLVIATHRSGYRPPWMQKSFATQISLRPLSTEQGLSLLHSMAGAEPMRDHIATAILARAEGNPFVLEELARAVIERGQDPVRTAVPDSVQGALLDRIDRIPDPSRRLLQIASVIGRRVPLSLVCVVWDESAPPEPLLQDLARLEFLHEDLAAAEPAYVFKHAVTQEVVYGTLLESRRKVCHAAVGEALESLYRGRHAVIVELLAYHFGRSLNDDKAVDYAMAAGEKAQRRWANEEALHHFEAALGRISLLPDTAAHRLRRIDVVIKQAEAKFALGSHAAELTALEDIADLVEDSGDPSRQAAWHYWVGFLGSLTGSRTEIATQHCERAAAIAKLHGIPTIEACAQSCLTQIALFMGDLRHGLEIGERAVTSFEHSDDLWWAGRTLGHLSPIANALAEWSRALDYGRRALAHAHTLGDQRLKVTALLRMASTLIQQGDGAAGLALCDQATDLVPGPFDLNAVRAIRGYGLSRAHDVAGGISLLEGVLEWLDRSQLRYTHCQVALWLAEAYLRTSDRERAVSLIQRTLEDATALGYGHLAGVAHRLCAAATPSPEEAALHLSSAIGLLRGVDARFEVAKVLEAWAGLDLRAGRLESGQRRLEEAAQILSRLGMADQIAQIKSTNPRFTT